MVIKISGLSWTGEFEVYGKKVHTFVYASDTKEKAKELAKTLRTIDLLEMNGPLLREPYSKPLENGIFELRTKQGSDITRVLYFFIVGKKAVLTNGFIKKSQKTPKAEKELAKKYKADYERNKKSRPEYSEKTCTGIRDAIKAGICSDVNKK